MNHVSRPTRWYKKAVVIRPVGGRPHNDNRYTAGRPLNFTVKRSTGRLTSLLCGRPFNVRSLYGRLPSEVIPPNNRLLTRRCWCGNLIEIMYPYYLLQNRLVFVRLFGRIRYVNSYYRPKCRCFLRPLSDYSRCRWTVLFVTYGLYELWTELCIIIEAFTSSIHLCINKQGHVISSTTYNFRFLIMWVAASVGRITKTVIRTTGRIFTAIKTLNLAVSALVECFRSRSPCLVPIESSYAPSYSDTNLSCPVSEI